MRVTERSDGIEPLLVGHDEQNVGPAHMSLRSRGCGRRISDQIEAHQRKYAEMFLPQLRDQHGTSTLWDCLGGCEFATCQAAKCFEIFRGSFLDYILWKARGRRSLIPVEGLQIVAHELFVETGWTLSDDVLVLWPEAR